LPHGGIISGFGADEELAIGVRERLVRQKLPQDRRSELASATAAVSKASEANNRHIHGALLLDRLTSSLLSKQSRIMMLGWRQFFRRYGVFKSVRVQTVEALTCNLGLRVHQESELRAGRSGQSHVVSEVICQPISLPRAK
jgi:hypothetical protein